MKLHQLRYFQYLTHYLHYRKASEALYISQPTLSFAIKEFEKELGVDLLKKEGRTITLTQEGTTFFKLCYKKFSNLRRRRAGNYAQTRNSNFFHSYCYQ